MNNKFLYSSLLCVALASVYAQASDGADQMDDLKNPAEELRLDNLDNVKDAMDESEHTKMLSDIMKNHSESSSHSAVAASMPELTAKDIQGDIMMHKNIARKLFDVKNVLASLVIRLGGRFNSEQRQYAISMNNEEDLSESDLVMIKTLKKLMNLCEKASMAHNKAAEIYDGLQALVKAGFEPGEKLESMAAELSKQATQASIEADREMESLLGLKPIVKF